MNIKNTNTKSEKRQKLKKISIELYKLCFDDSDEFVDFYFQKRYTEKQHFTILQNDNPVAALQAIPYKMTFCSAKINISYLSAICTHPDFRKQGLMIKLLAKTHKQLFEADVYATFLIPADLWLFNVYAKTDYKTIFYRTKKQISACGFEIKNDCKIYEYSETNKNDAFKYFDCKMNSRNYCVQHSFADFEIICEDIYNNNGIILIAEHNNAIVGISFATYINDSFTVIEHFADTQEISESLLKAISNKTKNDDLTYIDIPQQNNYEAIGMMRIICAEKMLQLYAKTHPACKKTIFVKDDTIVENSGCYIISNAKCIKSPLVNAQNVWNIAELTQFVFAEQMPYMSLMLNE
ncbi:MAG: GNAT family N-acetyltransferase [Prevotellaceae bacterium]|jgi:predicted acetyltransferase|nr:GNAT family N-acetyltransferase [Prevotellaceae bacterium]